MRGDEGRGGGGRAAGALGGGPVGAAPAARAAGSGGGAPRRSHQGRRRYRHATLRFPVFAGTRVTPKCRARASPRPHPSPCTGSSADQGGGQDAVQQGAHPGRAVQQRGAAGGAGLWGPGGPRARSPPPRWAPPPARSLTRAPLLPPGGRSPRQQRPAARLRRCAPCGVHATRAARAAPRCAATRAPGRAWRPRQARAAGAHAQCAPAGAGGSRRGRGGERGAGSSSPAPAPPPPPPAAAPFPTAQARRRSRARASPSAAAPPTAALASGAWRSGWTTGAPRRAVPRWPLLGRFAAAATPNTARGLSPLSSLLPTPTRRACARAEVEVPVPLEVCWALWDDRERIPQWMPWIKSVKVLEEDPRLSRWTLSTHQFGR
jgi:hypothetical protein